MALTIELRYVIPREWCKSRNGSTLQKLKVGKKGFAAGFFGGDSAIAGGAVEYPGEDVVHYAIAVLFRPDV